MTHRRVVRRILTVASVACLAWAAPTPAVAASPLDGNGFAVGGPKIDLSTAQGDPTKIQPGIYQSQLPLDTTPRYVELTRQPGERLEFSVVGSAAWKGNKFNVDSDVYQGLTLSVRDTDGNYCSTNSGATTSSDVGMVAASVALDATKTERMATGMDDACFKSTKFIVQIKRQYDGNEAQAMPVQLGLVRTPKVEKSDTAVSTSEMGEMPYTALTATETVKPGDGFTTATPLKAGGYNVSAPTGRRMFFKVHLGWNQRLSVGWEAPKNGANFYASQSYEGSAVLYTPSLTRSKSYGTGAVHISSGKASQYDTSATGLYTAPVRYANADVKDDDSKVDARSTTAPGWYYVVLSLGPGYDKELTGHQDVPTALSIRVEGKPDAGPSMNVAEPEPGAISTQASTALSPAIWGSVLAAGLIAIAGIAAFLFRRSHRKQS